MIDRERQHASDSPSEARRDILGLALTTTNDEHRKLYRGDDGSYTIFARGEITLVLRPGTSSPQTLEPPPLPSHATDDTPAPSPDQPEQPPATTDGSPAAEGRDKRHQLTGIVGRTPRFKQTRRGKPVASFPLAEHPQEGETHWREIRAFGRVAEFVRDSVQPGQQVEVTAYGPKTWSEWRKTQAGYAQRPVTGFYAGRIRVPQQPDSGA